VLGSLLCIFISVATLWQIEAESPLGQMPPRLSLNVGEQHQQAVFDGFAWRGAIADTFQYMAPRDPLKADTAFTARLDLQSRLGPPTKASCTLSRVVPDDCWMGDDPHFTCWQPEERIASVRCPALESGAQVDLDFSVPPGLYVLVVKAWWNNVGGGNQHFSIYVEEP
jgi:hypothetical protein